VLNSNSICLSNAVTLETKEEKKEIKKNEKSSQLTGQRARNIKGEAEQ
jgi:hypothetical protein